MELVCDFFGDEMPLTGFFVLWLLVLHRTPPLVAYWGMLAGLPEAMKKTISTESTPRGIPSNNSGSPPSSEVGPKDSGWKVIEYSFSRSSEGQNFEVLKSCWDNLKKTRKFFR
ncbi:hypothetical protein ALC56_11728 [Trachymyrmex septentrionalis]|uniref:Uncharacterized protein n=1 Tax=Trachymyrmex septentrionalis TaxID=34720 RepID=A0A195F019_9HYME|nr:hypothetical protein ALC56_11728 [Trachymyrmex septentrionalis]